MDKQKQIERLKNLERIKKYGVPMDKIDWDKVDGSLSYKENKRIILEYVKQIAKTVDSNEAIEKDKTNENIKHEKEVEEQVKKEEVEREEEHIKKELDKSVNEIKTKTTDKLDEYFNTPKKLIETLINSDDTNGLILKGTAGIGKSYTTVQKLREMDLKKGEDFELINSYITPLSLYRFLYKHRNKIIVLDDTMGFFSNERNIGMILSGLWGDSGRRIIQYNSSKLNDIPNKFEFGGKMIVCLNELPKQLTHIKSRCFYYEMRYSNKEIMEMITEIAKLNKIPMEVVDFIKNNVDDDVVNLDFRLLFKVYDVYKNNEDCWKEIAGELISKDKSVGLVMRMLRKHDTVGEARREWQKKTGKSKSTFFRIKRSMTK